MSTQLRSTGVGKGLDNAFPELQPQISSMSKYVHEPLSLNLIIPKPLPPGSFFAQNPRSLVNLDHENPGLPNQTLNPGLPESLAIKPRSLEP